MGVSSHRRLGDRVIKTLALDLASLSGYAIRLGSGELKLGVVRLNRGIAGRSGTRNPIPAQRLWIRLNSLAENYRVERVIYEETFARGNAKWLLDSLQFVATLWALEHQVKWLRVSPTKWKGAVMGKNVSKEEYTRQAIKRWPNTRLWTDDMCAARWLLEYVEQGETS